MGPLTCQPNVAIDGFAGSGKTTVAVELARQLKLVYLDTGLMYRAVALQCLRSGVDPHDSQAMDELVNRLDLRVEVNSDQGHPTCQMILAGVDVTASLHDPQVTRLVPAVASVSKVRRELVARQQAFARRGGVVMVGRDIASVVLPDAPVKIFLVAELKERARRRCLELQQRGKAVTLEDVEADLAARDQQDSEREDSPLVCVDQARVLDSTGLSVEQVVQQISEWTLQASLPQ